MGFNIGMLVGVQVAILFTLIAQPGKWLFKGLESGQAIAMYGYSLILFCTLTAFVGFLIEKRYFKRTKEIIDL